MEGTRTPGRGIAGVWERSQTPARYAHGFRLGLTVLVAPESPGLVELTGLAGGFARPLDDHRLRGGGDSADVDALSAVPGDELVVVRVVAGVGDLAQRELLA